MTDKQFNDFQKLLSDYRKDLLRVKGQEYGEMLDRFSNFKEIAEIVKISPRKIALILMLKHFIKIRNICVGITKNDYNLKPEKLLEAFGDVLNYLELIYGMIIDNNQIMEESETIMTDKIMSKS